MNTKTNFILIILICGAALGLTACGTTSGTGATNASGTTATTSTATATVEAALPLIRTGAAVAAGAVLNFAEKQSSSRTRLANEMYSAASAIYSLSGGTSPTPAQFQATVLSYGGSQQDAAYATYATDVAGLYASYYPKLATGDAKTATDLLNAIAGGIEDATQSYVITPNANVAAN